MGERTHRRKTKEVSQQVRRNVRLLLRPNGSLVTAHFTSFSMVSDNVIICPAAGDCKTILILSPQGGGLAGTPGYFAQVALPLNRKGKK